jgi:predicted dehydrogenase
VSRLDGRRNGRPYKPLNVAVVGLGYWGPNLVRNLHELEVTEISLVCDLRASAREAIKRRYPAVTTCADFGEVLASPEVEAVAIVTPVGTHHALASAALAAGKHVFVEKPLAASAVEGAALGALAAREALVLMPGHTFLYSPPVNIVRSLIASGELGDVHFISTSRVNLGLHQSDVSVVWDLAPHDFSILRYWLDETPTAISAMSRCCIVPTTPDVAFINLEFPSGTVAHSELAWLAPSKLRRTTIVGSRKMVVYDDTSTEPVRVFDSGVIRNPGTFGEYHLSYRTGDIVSPHVAPDEPLALELRDFADAVRTGSQPRSSAELGLEVVRMIEAVDRSLEQNGARVTVETSASSQSRASQAQLQRSHASIVMPRRLRRRSPRPAR